MRSQRNPRFSSRSSVCGYLQSRIDDERVGRIAPAQHVAVLIERRVDDDGQLDEVAQRVGHDPKDYAGLALIGPRTSEAVIGSTNPAPCRSRRRGASGLDQRTIEHLAHVIHGNDLDCIEDFPCRSRTGRARSSPAG